MTQSKRPPTFLHMRSWHKLTMVPLLLFFLTPLIQGQIVINEFDASGTVELKNLGTSPVNVSSYWLCDFPVYEPISSLTLECGSMMLAAGEIMAVSGWNIDSNDSELGLYTTNSFGSSTALIDYVEWGSSGHQRASVAIAAGIWSAGDFLPSIPAGESYAYDGDGNTPSDFAFGANTFCGENDASGACAADGGALTGGPFIFDQVGDGVADNIPAGSITVANTTGENFAWVVTDANGIILGLPPMPSAVNFDNPGAGNCLVWHLAYDGEISGAEPGLNANDIEGCFDLSNPIEVIRTNASGCNANGGDLFGGPFIFDQVGDGVADNIPAGSITVANTTGENFAWVVTDANGIILGLPPMPSAVNFDNPGAGNCLVWYLAYDGEISGAEVGLNASDIEGCFDLSNPIEVIRTNASGCNANGGELFGGPFNFTVDGTPDMIPAGSITLANANGENMQWVITDNQGNILGLPPMPSVVDFDAAGAGVCYVYNVSYDGVITGLEAGENINNLDGCHALSNFIVVTRTEAAEDCVDLTLDIQAESNLYTQFENTSFTFTVTNEGTETATNIEIDATFPSGLVYVSDFASHGSLELAWQTWNISSLAPGETATLNLTLFALLDGVDITYFTQVISLDQADKDSTPDSSDGAVTEDDEASATITPRSAGGFGTNDGNIDLEISISTQSNTYDIYEVVRYRIEVKNNGSETATDVVVNAGLPDGMVFINATVNNGEYNLFFEKWMIEFIGAGETATLDLDLFTLVVDVDITNFVQIASTNERDPDSTPGNSNGQVNEDDEASVTLTYADGLNEDSTLERNTATKMMQIENAYPNPANEFIMLPINSDIDLQTDVNIIDVSGRVVLTKTMKVFKGYNRFNIDTSELSDGIYFISLDGLDITNSNRRFVKVGY